ncbi:MAG: hypothetical protein DHS20C14_21400 [Phycisphaeraceae bacterium]|nr:MAG: hypothetical protein DHS20C14_21400 [Phycisphaeraceae bacterium]
MDRVRTPRAARVRAGIGFALALVLIGAAVYAVVSSRAQIVEAFDRIWPAPAWLVVTLLVVPAMSWLASAGALWSLTRRFGRVAPGEMTALVGSSWLLNYLPLKPGLVGRLAYHKRVNGIPIRKSARVLVESVGLTAIAGALVLAIGLATRAWPVHVGIEIALVTAPAVLLGAACLIRPPGASGGWLLLAMLFRYLDMLVWIARYWAIFYALDRPIGLDECVLIASASQLSVIVPITGNGLGVREWAVGLTAAAVGGDLQIALAADLVNRVAEILVAVPIGLLSARLVARRYARREHARSGAEPNTCAPIADMPEEDSNPPPC